MFTSRIARTACIAALALSASPIASAWPGTNLLRHLLPEVVRLRTGETIKGRLIPNKSNEAVAVFEDYVSGAVREIAWPAIEESDGEKLKIALGILNPDMGRGTVELPGVLVTFRLNVGTDDVRGAVVSEDATSLTLKTAGGPIVIAKDKIVSREDVMCDATELYTPDELATRRKTEDNPSDARAWFKYAQYCEAVGAYAQAKEAYEIAATDPEFLNREVAATKVTQLTALLKDQDALRTLRDLKMALGSYLFQKVRTGLAKFGEKHPDASKAVLDQVAALTAQFKKVRDTYFAGEAGKSLVKVLEKLIVAKVKDKEAQITEVQQWAKKELTDQAMGELAKVLQSRDPEVTPEETKGFWTARPKKGWYQATYGKGTFVAIPPKMKPPQNKPPPPSNNNSNKGPTVQISVPKPPTRDSWWAAENTDGRKQWMLAYYVEGEGIFEVAPKHVKTPCSTCNGTGLETKTLSTSTLTYLCTRCAGAQMDEAVKFR